MKLLFVDACPRKVSRTRELAETLLNHLNGEKEHLILSETDLPVMDEATLTLRDAAAKAQDFSAPPFRFARQFAAADAIVIAAPLWDLSFPALLKRYIELITVTGLTFKYSEKGIPVGLCQAKNLYYVTTSGGPILTPEFGYGYVKALATGMFGIPNCAFYSAEGLDIWGNDAGAILAEAKAKIEKDFA